MFNKIEEQKKIDGSNFYNGVTVEKFKEITQSNIRLITSAFESELVVPNWTEFQKDIGELFTKCKANEEGAVATYIPQLGQVDPKNWALSICTVDGQRFNLGNFKEYFTIQSVSKPFTYAIALDNLGEEAVHRYVGKEPSGRMFNELILNHENKPHNPMINPGAIVVCSLIHSMVQSFGGKPSLVFENTKNYFDKLGGVLHVGFNTSVYISEQEAADRNYAISFYLKEHKCFPPESRLGDTLKFYFRCCSLEVNTNILALMGATLANSGINPITSERIFKASSVKNTLSLMYSCGMYDYSGEFAFEVGLPGKSGVSGAMVIAIPDVMGIGLWSPKLCRLGNSIRGIQFCKELVKQYPYHQYDNQRIFPDHADRRKVISESDKNIMTTFEILSAAAGGHLHTLKKFYLYGINLGLKDYDGRTALHLAAAEGHLNCVDFLLNYAQVKMDTADRWGQTPLMVAQTNNQTNIVSFLKSYKPTDKKIDNKKKTTKNVGVNIPSDEPDFNPLDLHQRPSDKPKKDDGT
ncbi:putative glutaminase 2 isoform X2 [Harmonia axyridis]|nr:putative glutaminase 2 isoform X2 [Harmonia axyridis]XP_045483432.1 putative glutaminase 2 isoform X2 [Harmonia axyridis]